MGAMNETAFAPLAAYVKKLERRAPLPALERHALLSIPGFIRQFHGHSTALMEGHPARTCVFVLEGVVSRQKKMDDTRSIVSFCFPGDAVDLQALFFDRVDHSIVTHKATTLAFVDYGEIIELIDRYPLIAKVLWHDTLVEASIFREWTINVGHRQAVDRIGHLLLEFEMRMIPDSARRTGHYELPLTQTELAAALGLSLVHLNKSLRKLRQEGLIAVGGSQICILDRARLAERVCFRDGYLYQTAAPVLSKPETADSRSRATSEPVLDLL